MSSGSKRPGPISRFMGLFKSTNSGAEVENDALACDRPPLPTCIHPNHTTDSVIGKAHLCALAEGSELVAQDTMRPEPEISQYVPR